MARKPIGYRFPTAEELLAHALTLEGHRARDVAVEVERPAFNASPKPFGKKGVGNLVQLYLGRQEDNRREPDFPELGIELKTLPMKALRPGKKRDWTVKEPTSITMIDYGEVAREAWNLAYVRHKMDHVLWVPYEHSYADVRESRFRRAFLWKPDAGDYPAFGMDYDAVRGYIRRGQAHLLSETLSRILAARRKGSKGQMAPQPHGPMAKSRAWAFKPAYTRPILDKHVLGRPTVSLVGEIAQVRTLLDVEPFVAARLGRYEGKTLRQIGASTGAKIAGGKAGPATFVRKLLGVKQRGSIEEFQKLGTRIHTVWARPRDLFPWEAVSFPAMRLKEFVLEEWPDAELVEHVDRILFIPLFSETRKATDERRLGKPFFWSPSPAQLERIRLEWLVYQRAVKAGRTKYEQLRTEQGGLRYDVRGRPMRENRLPKMEDTEIIHMRPHGEDAKDVDVDPRGNRVTKQCFWLNKSFVQRLLKNGRGA